MNIFMLDYDMNVNVTFYPDKHIVKMPIEGVQMLCTAYSQEERARYPFLYKITHYNHPCSI